MNHLAIGLRSCSKAAAVLVSSVEEAKKPDEVHDLKPITLQVFLKENSSLALLVTAAVAAMACSHRRQPVEKDVLKIEPRRRRQ